MDSHWESNYHPISSAPTQIAGDLNIQNDNEMSMFFDFGAWDHATSHVRAYTELSCGKPTSIVDLPCDFGQHLSHNKAAPEPPYSRDPWVEPGLSPYADGVL